MYLIVVRSMQFRRQALPLHSSGLRHSIHHYSVFQPLYNHKNIISLLLKVLFTFITYLLCSMTSLSLRNVTPSENSKSKEGRPFGTPIHGCLSYNCCGNRMASFSFSGVTTVVVTPISRSWSYRCSSS